MAPSVFVTRPVPGAVEALTAQGLDVRLQGHDRPVTRDELLDGVAGAVALLCLLTDTVDGDVMDAAGERLRIVANFAVGYDNIDVEAAAARGIVVTNTPGVLTEATADLAITLLLAVSRRVREGEALARSGSWTGWGPSQLLGRSLHGKALGIVGMGAIGQAVARRALAFGMQVLYHTRSPVPGAPPDTRPVDLETLLAASDVISLHTPLTDRTRHLLDDETLARTKPGVIIVNTARGPLIDEAALVAALDAGHVAGAGLDVFEHEPAIPAGLRDRDDVVLLPHLGSATHETRRAMGQLCAENITAVLAGQSPVTPVVTAPKARS